MRIPRQSFWIGVALAALAVLLYVWWIATHEKQWYDRTVPVQGEANYNRYYVLQQALRAQGLHVQSLPHLPAGIEHWSEHDTLLLGSDPRTLSPRQLDDLLDWVERGGRLIVAPSLDTASYGNGMMPRIGVAQRQGVHCMKWQNANAGSDERCFEAFAFANAAERANFEVAIGDADQGWIAARRSWGSGQIEVLGGFEPLDNAAVAEPHNADWAWQMLAPMLQTGGAFRIVYQTELPPLYVYLVRYGWYALLPLLIALLAWLWTRSQRFGPTMPLPAPDRRALGEHIQASGEYLYRRGLVQALYAPLRRRFDDVLRRRDPELAALPTNEIASALARHHRLPLEAVQQALRAPLPRQPQNFLSTVQTLLHLIRQP
jgi:hypothetical protein